MLKPVAGLGVALLLAACGSQPAKPTGSHAGVAPLPAPPPDAALVPDATPRVEERSKYGNPAFYVVAGQRYVVLASSAGYSERGVASWYGPGFHGVNTAMGEPYDMYGMTAAHRTLPIPCYARITNLGNGRSVVVRINDRGPFVANRIVDLSYSAALKLDMVRTGTAFVQLDVLSPGSPVIAGNSTLATDTAATAPVPTPPPVPVEQKLYVQVGAFSDAANTDRAVRRLRAAHVDGVLVSSATSNGRTLQRVRVGPVSTVDAFDALVARLATLGFNNARLAQESD
ncbi:MAG TPA: septal ring lytic transglycosylase RlpA family protein [Steroidobacteraceae bacterium]|nr:septal ring lytic transglycosylase RlpA family protein [Steroidobacteraceae bacterium]